MYALTPLSGEEMRGREDIRGYQGDYAPRAQGQRHRITGVILLGGSSLTRSLFENMSLMLGVYPAPLEVGTLDRGTSRTLLFPSTWTRSRPEMWMDRSASDQCGYHHFTRASFLAKFQRKVSFISCRLRASFFYNVPLCSRNVSPFCLSNFTVAVGGISSVYHTVKVVCQILIIHLILIDNVGYFLIVINSLP